MATLLTNSQLVSSLGLPEDILTKLATAQGTEYQAASNQFIEAIVNKIVYQKVHSMSFTNPFRKYEGYAVKFGDTIENIFVDVPTGYTFDKDATDPFTKYVNNVKALYATINFEMQYPTTIQDTLLRRAVLTENGLMNLVNEIISRMGQRKDIDEYQATVYMLNNEDIYADGFEEVDVSEAATPLDRAKIVTKQIIKTVTDFALPSKENNKLGVLNVTPKEDCVLIIKQELLNDIDLDYLTGVFNLSKVDLVKNIIPVRSFQVIKPGDETADPEVEPSAVGEDLAFVIVDSRGFDIHSALEDSGMIYNPKGKYTNHFTNDWKIISYKYFYNARAFKLVEE